MKKKKKNISRLFVFMCLQHQQNVPVINLDVTINRNEWHNTEGKFIEI
jgi:hypothetical protein